MSKCDMVRDMLPLVAEEMASAETKRFVEEHTTLCRECRGELERMRRALRPEAEESAPLRAVRREMRVRRALTVIMTAALVMAIVVPCVSLMTRPIFRPYDPDTVYISLEEAGGRTRVESVLMADVQNAGWYWAENGDRQSATLYVYAYDTLYDTLCGKKLMVTFGPREWREDLPITQVYYQQSGGAENVLLWGADTGERQITLPRLVLGYYLIMAGAAAGVLGAAWAIVWIRERRRSADARPEGLEPAAPFGCGDGGGHTEQNGHGDGDAMVPGRDQCLPSGRRDRKVLFSRRKGGGRAGRLLVRLWLTPCCYIAAHVSILFFQTASYSAQKDFIFVWCMWALLYTACLCALRLARR